ncbi:hypothetical protein NKH36_29435 [Mesorhizobium sp. M1312]|uniref:hypothetical protein n=1 Tax=unclassified Mesorhizobium TaxID=325217 RepID=UPI00333BEB54
MLDELKSLDDDAFQAKYAVLLDEAHKQAVACFHMRSRVRESDFKILGVFSAASAFPQIAGFEHWQLRLRRDG